MGTGTVAAAALMRLDMLPRWYLSATITGFGSEEHRAPISGGVDGGVLLYRSEIDPRGE